MCVVYWRIATSALHTRKLISQKSDLKLGPGGPLNFFTFDFVNRQIKLPGNLLIINQWNKIKLSIRKSSISDDVDSKEWSGSVSSLLRVHPGNKENAEN